MRTAVLAGSSLVSFAVALGLLLYDPRTELAIGVAALLCLLVVPFWRIDLVPWLVAPLGAALGVWAPSAPGGYILSYVGAALCGAIFGLLAFVRLALWRTPASRFVQGVWLGSAVIGIVVLVAARGTTSLELRFALSEDAMTRTAGDIIEGRRNPATIDRIGLWKVRNVTREPGAVRFFVQGAGIFDSHGFLYPTNGLQPPDAVYYGSGWYTFTSDFEL